ncbi:MAG: hypothetical protein ACR2OC_08765 [Solirubrobacterales bacterium]
MRAASIRAWFGRLPERHGRTTLIVLAVVVLVALGLRVARAHEPIAAPGPDSDAYSALSSYLYKTGEYGTPGMENESDWSPGAVLFYTGVYVATGGVREEAARYAVALLGALLVLVVYALARRLARSANDLRATNDERQLLSEPVAGLVAAGATAIYPAFIYDAGRLMSEPFAELTLAGFVLAFVWASDWGGGEAEGGYHPPMPSAYLAPGALLGLTSLFRPEYLPFCVVFALLAAIWGWRRSGRSAGALLRPALALLAAFAIVVLPWTVRNAVELDRFVPVSTGGGKALYIGTYLPGDGDHFGTKRALFYASHPGIDVSPEEVNLLPMQPFLDAVADSRPELERDAALGAIGKENLGNYLTEQPLDFAGMMGRKIWRMWRSGSGPGMDGAWQEVLHAALGLAGLAGLILLAVRRRPEALVIALLVLGITAIGAVLLASTRRNLILMPVVIALAGVAITWVVARFRPTPAVSSTRSWSRPDPSSPRSSPPS